MRKLLGTSPLVNVLLVAIIWSFEVFIAKLALLAGAKVVTFTIQTYLVTFFLLFIFVAPIIVKEIKKIPSRALKEIMIANAFHNGIGGFFSYIGILLTTAINAGFLLQFTTVTTSTLAWIFLKEKMTKSKAVTITTILIGTFLLVTNGSFNIPHIGDMLILLACLSWSLATVIIRKNLKKSEINPDIISFLRPIAGIPIQIGLVILAPWYPLPIRSTFTLSLFDFRYGGYVIIHGLLVALLWIFLNRTLKLASASYMTMMTSLTPIIVAVLAMVFLHEALTVIQWFGAILILSSSVVTQYLKVEKH